MCSLKDMYKFDKCSLALIIFSIISAFVCICSKQYYAVGPVHCFGFDTIMCIAGLALLRKCTPIKDNIYCSVVFCINLILLAWHSVVLPFDVTIVFICSLFVYVLIVDIEIPYVFLIGGSIVLYTYCFTEMNNDTKVSWQVQYICVFMIISYSVVYVCIKLLLAKVDMYIESSYIDSDTKCYNINYYNYLKDNKDDLVDNYTLVLVRLFGDLDSRDYHYNIISSYLANCVNNGKCIRLGTNEFLIVCESCEKCSVIYSCKDMDKQLNTKEFKVHIKHKVSYLDGNITNLPKDVDKLYNKLNK